VFFSNGRLSQQARKACLRAVTVTANLRVGQVDAAISSIN